MIDSVQKYPGNREYNLFGPDYYQEGVSISESTFHSTNKDNLIRDSSLIGNKISENESSQLGSKAVEKSLNIDIAGTSVLKLKEEEPKAPEGIDIVSAKMFTNTSADNSANVKNKLNGNILNKVLKSLPLDKIFFRDKKKSALGRTRGDSMKDSKPDGGKAIKSLWRKVTGKKTNLGKFNDYLPIVKNALKKTLSYKTNDNDTEKKDSIFNGGKKTVDKVESINQQNVNHNSLFSEIYNNKNEKNKSKTRSVYDRKEDNWFKSDIDEAISETTHVDSDSIPTISNYLSPTIPNDDKYENSLYLKNEDKNQYTNNRKGLVDNTNLYEKKYYENIFPSEDEQITHSYNPILDISEAELRNRNNILIPTPVRSILSGERESSQYDHKTDYDKYVVGDSTNVTCPRPAEAKFATMKVKGVGSGAVAIYKCHKGYIGSSLMFRKCNRLGQWNGVSPVCVKGSFVGFMYFKFHIIFCLPQVSNGFDILLSTMLRLKFNCSTIIFSYC